VQLKKKRIPQRLIHRNQKSKAVRNRKKKKETRELDNRRMGSEGSRKAVGKKTKILNSQQKIRGKL